MKGFCLMLKKIIALFSRPAPVKPYTPPIPAVWYQPDLPFIPDGDELPCRGMNASVPLSAKKI